MLKSNETPDTPVLSGARKQEPRLDGELGDAVVRDMAGRPLPKAHVIVLGNEKGGVGKSTLAFHIAIALSSQGRRVAAIDLDRRQQTLTRAMTHREATKRRLAVDLSVPRYATVTQQSAACLIQEIARIGSDCEFVIIDVPGFDSPIARRAIAMADTLVTPVNPSFLDLDLLGQFDGLTHAFKSLGHFTELVHELRDARTAHKMPELDWIVMPNRVRSRGSRTEAQAFEALQILSERADFRLGQGLTERVAYRELFLLGLTHLDLRRIPQLSNIRAMAKAEVTCLIDDLCLPVPSGNLSTKTRQWFGTK